MSDGWVHAIVTKDFDETQYDPKEPNATGVHVTFTWPFWYNHRGFLLDDCTDILPPPRVRLISKAKLASISGTWNNNASGKVDRPSTVDQPTLGLLVVRYGGKERPEHDSTVPSQWGSSGPPISDNFIVRLIDYCGGRDKNINSLDVEVWSLFLERGEDARNFARTAHLILHPGHPLRRCKRVFGCYHMFPTTFEEYSHPFLETGDENGAGYIDSRALMELMMAVERCDIPTLFPHSSYLYDLLASKRWTHLCCLDPQLCIPASCSLPRAEALSSRGPGMVVTTLNRIRQKMTGNNCEAGGVCKIGYSWEAFDVKRWKDELALADVLQQLAGHVYIDDNQTGQPHFVDTILCQEYIEHLSELRCYVINHKIEKYCWTKFMRVNEQLDFKEFEQAKDEKEACERWFDGDESRILKAKEQAQNLVDRWLLWLQTQACEDIPVIRFDFYVAKDSLYTGEITECGFSMLYDESLPHKVFQALADRARGLTETNRSVMKLNVGS